MTTIPTKPVPVVGEAMRSALLAHSRPRRPNALSVSLTFAWRAVLTLVRIPEQLGDVIAIPIIFTLLFTYLFGGALAGSTGKYLQFLLPGTLAMTVLLVTVGAGIGLNTDVTTGVFDRFRTTPIWRPAPIVGALLGDIGRYLLASTLVSVWGWRSASVLREASLGCCWRSRWSWYSRSVCRGSGPHSRWLRGRRPS
jgi:ABC-2 type transport system permease protein